MRSAGGRMERNLPIKKAGRLGGPQSGYKENHREIPVPGSQPSSAVVHPPDELFHLPLIHPPGVGGGAGIRQGDFRQLGQILSEGRLLHARLFQCTGNGELVQHPLDERDEAAHRLLGIEGFHPHLSRQPGVAFRRAAVVAGRLPQPALKAMTWGRTMALARPWGSR